MHSKIFIIILNYNGVLDTIDCLASLYKQDYPHFEVVVVDNGSTDDSVQVISRIYPNVIVIENKTNYGYTGGNNIGIQYAIENDAQYVWLLNNDTIVESDSLSKLFMAANESVNIGLASPLIYYYDKPSEIQFSGNIINWREKNISVVRDVELLTNKTALKNMALWGTALLIKRDVINKIGILNDKYFAYHEDIEYSSRAIKNGFINIVVPSSKVYHKFAHTSGGIYSPLHCYFMTRNIFFFWMDNLPFLGRLTYLRKYLANSIYLVANLKKTGKNESVDACLAGIWSAFRGISGPWNKEIKMPTFYKRVILSNPFFWVYLLKGNFIKILSGLFIRNHA